MKMKKYIQSMMAFAAIVSFASCSSEDNNTTIENESAVKVMTFTATQEGDEQSTRAAISSTDRKVINWEEGDKISLLYGSKNKEFTLTEGAGSTSGKFSGEALESGPYTAVYPYQSTASLSGNDVTNVTIPATQTATANSFDKNAALMMAQSNSTTLEFKNVVGYVKVKPKFACSKIELEAAEGSSDILAGKGTLNWNGGNPKINITEETSKTITLNGSIAKDNSYYIVVPTGTLNRMWKITFTADDGKKYTRYCSKPLTIERNKIINLGNFATDSPFWADEYRGNKVTYEQEVDLGLTITGSDNKKYKVIFANANLTANGLATNEYGDYFAWGATEPWYTSYTGTNFNDWKPGHTNGYANGTAPTFNGKYDEKKDFEMSDDPARKILGGGWQIPTKTIWEELKSKMNNLTKKGFNSERKGYEFVNNDQTLFLPAAGEVNGTSFNYVGSYGEYWSGTAYSSTDAYYLSFDESGFNVQIIYDRYCGYSVRPVRLVELSATNTEGYNENDFNWE